MAVWSEPEGSIDDINLHVEKVDDMRTLQCGLSGLRSVTAVNHLVAVCSSDNPDIKCDFRIASDYIMEHLSNQVGLEAIRVMYASSWPSNNPSVHDFIFEWDILTRLSTSQGLAVADAFGNEMEWQFAKIQRLAEFLCGGPPLQNVLVIPEKWNHPEYDSLCIFCDPDGTLHLIAWNASEAATHSGNASSLLVMLEALSQRVMNPINFATVWFVFLVPKMNMAQFRPPSDSASLLAMQQLVVWSFHGFEVYWTERSEPF